jgi:hypothetical protein
MINLNELQLQEKVWAKKNRITESGEQVLLTLMEELGQLAYIHQQATDIHDGYLGDPKHKLSAVGDMVISLASYCNAEGLNLEQCITDAHANLQYWRERNKAE